MPLSDFFPQDLKDSTATARNDLYRAKIVPGVVFRTKSYTLNSGDEKEKRFLVASINPFIVFIINSEISARYTKDQTAALPCQVKVQADGTCFDKECHIDCWRVWEEFDFNNIINLCTAGKCQILGSISDKVRAEVCNAATSSTTFTHIEMSSITQA